MKRFIPLIIGGLLVVVSMFGLFTWFLCRIYVPEGKCAVLIKKTGELLPEGESVATKSGQRGIQQQVLGPGRHFRDPLRWDWQLVDLTEIPSGDPKTWKLTVGTRSGGDLSSGQYTFEGEFPKIGVVTRKVGKRPPQGQVVVSRASGYQGILEEVLTPGVYKINPYVYEVETYPATVIPAGFVGVVTNLFGADRADAVSAETPTSGPTGLGDEGSASSYQRRMASADERGTVRDVLQPGIYFINPKLKKVTLVEIGYNEYSQLRIDEISDSQISFPSDTGYLIRVGVTVVWGIDPDHAAEIVNNFGNVDKVLEKVINPQLRSICRNIGSTYAARDFIQGEKREQFQRDMTAELQRVCAAKNVEVLLALVRDIEVHAPMAEAGGGKTSVTEDLKRTIQQSYIAIESQLTKEKQREAATKKAELEEVKKRVDIARETIRAETRILVANIKAEGDKRAAEIAAEAGLEVATIQQQVASLDAQRRQILGQAAADVERMKRDADAQGYRMLVSAFGSPQAYNLYTFTEDFNPKSIRLIFAGQGTFWTDLSRFEDAGAAQLLQAADRPAPASSVSGNP
ncbi:MAG TPA: SPFH domain-containing protein [Phycisphaerae bacterium]|nr:SPFH domain-containing protein [Phycisphaerae bacterium]HRW52623.1 SPFH domain-containing protein [Phycisphaerae bacterium]